MCYKNEVQKSDGEKLEEKIKDMPEFIKEYFIFLKSNTTKLGNWGMLKLLFEWLIDQKIINNTLYKITPDDLSKVTSIHMIDYLDGIKSGKYGIMDKEGVIKGVSLATVNTKKNIFSGFWSYLVDEDYVKKNIITKKLSQKYEVKVQKKVLVPTDEELASFLSNLEGCKNEFVSLRNIAIVKSFTGSGIRISELVGLDIGDIYLDTGNPYIMVMRKGEQDELENIPISTEARDAIEDYLKVRSFFPYVENIKALFISDEGNRMSKKTISKFFEVYSNKTIHPHMLRHYTGTKMHKDGCDVVVISKQLGHKDVNTTAKIYIEPDEDACRKALNSF